LGLTTAAVSKGHEVTIFAMDDGVRLLRGIGFSDLCKMNGVSICFCDHSTTLLDLPKGEVSKDIVCGSQYNNAVMNHNADRIIVL
jgi:predicted peroxiredoxin